jgi:hypothetical protein
MDIRGRCCYTKENFKTCSARIDTALFHMGNDYDTYNAIAQAKNTRGKNAIIRKYLLKTMKLNRVDANEAISLFISQQHL